MAVVQPATPADPVQPTPPAELAVVPDSAPAAAPDSTPASAHAYDSGPVPDPAPVSNGTPPTKPETRPGVLLLRSWLSRIVRVKLTDGRVVAGTLRCIDRNRNLVLGSANERFGDGPPQTIGHVMVPGKHIVQLWVENLDAV